MEHFILLSDVLIILSISALKSSLISHDFQYFSFLFLRTFNPYSPSLLLRGFETNLRYRESRRIESKLAKEPPLSDIAWTIARSAEI